MLTLNIIETEDGAKMLSGTISGTKFNFKYSQSSMDTLTNLRNQINAAVDIESYTGFIADAVRVIERLSLNKSQITDTHADDLVYDSVKGHYYIKVGKQISKHPVPSRLVNVILESVEKGIDATPIIKAWVRFLRNPNFTSQKAEYFAAYITAVILDEEEKTRLMTKEGFTEEQATARALYNDVSITQEGLIVCKKHATLVTKGFEIDKKTNKVIKVPIYPKADDVVDAHTGEITKGKIQTPDINEDIIFQPPMQGLSGDAFLCGSELGHKIMVGNNITLKKWSQVNTDDGACCVKGLHVGGWRYVSTYSELKSQLLDCFVDPMEIGAILDVNQDDGAMRVREYFVFGATVGRNRSLYHSSEYSKIKDKEWEEFKRIAVQQADQVKATLDEAIEELH